MGHANDAVIDNPDGKVSPGNERRVKVGIFGLAVECRAGDVMNSVLCNAVVATMGGWGDAPAVNFQR